MNKSKLISIFLSSILVISLTSCKKETEETNSSTTSNTTVATTVNTEPSLESTIESVQEEVVENPLYDPSINFALNPLTGVQNMANENVGKRSIAVVINNKYEALPQRGICSADLIYEYETEGGQTRLLAVWADLNTIPEVGSLRSARILSSDLAAGTNSIFIHYGRNARVPEHLEAWGIDDVDGNYCSAGAYSSANGEVVLPDGLFYWRDSAWKSTRALEHTAVSNGSYIAASIDHYGVNLEGDTPMLFNFVRNDSADLVNAMDCNSLNVYFSATNDDALFTYDPDFHVYKKSQYGGKDQIDELTGEQLTVTNIIVIYTDTVPHGDSTIDCYPENGGTGYYASNGKITEITFSKPTPNDPIRIYNAAGEEVEVNRGICYICVVDNDYTDKTTFS